MIATAISRARMMYIPLPCRSPGIGASPARSIPSVLLAQHPPKISGAGFTPIDATPAGMHDSPNQTQKVIEAQMYGQARTLLMTGAFIGFSACSIVSGSSGGDEIDDIIDEIEVQATLGTLSYLDGADPAAEGGEGTLLRTEAMVSRASGGQIMLDMLSGPMEGMQLFCTDATLGACVVNGGPQGTTTEGTLVSRMSGNFAYVGHFSVVHVDANNEQYTNAHVVQTDLPEAWDYQMRLPEGTATYAGNFSAGVGLNTGNGTVGGTASGSAELVANFNTATLSGALSGAVDGDGTAVSASFNNLAIDLDTGGFVSGDNTLILFQDATAWGDVGGSFYGPDADEAAGIFSFGNDAGGMTGIFLTCKNGHDCVKH